MASIKNTGGYLNEAAALLDIPEEQRITSPYERTPVMVLRTDLLAITGNRDAALFLNHLIQLTEYHKTDWVYTSYRWLRDNFGFSRKAVDKIRKTLGGLGFLEERRGKSSTGATNALHYKPDFEAINTAKEKTINAPRGTIINAPRGTIINAPRGANKEINKEIYKKNNNTKHGEAAQNNVVVPFNNDVLKAAEPAHNAQTEPALIIPDALKTGGAAVLTAAQKRGDLTDSEKQAAIDDAAQMIRAKGFSIDNPVGYAIGVIRQWKPGNGAAAMEAIAAEKAAEKARRIEQDKENERRRLEASQRENDIRMGIIKENERQERLDESRREEARQRACKYIEIAKLKNELMNIQPVTDLEKADKAKALAQLAEMEEQIKMQNKPVSGNKTMTPLSVAAPRFLGKLEKTIKNRGGDVPKKNSNSIFGGLDAPVRFQIANNAPVLHSEPL